MGRFTGTVGDLLDAFYRQVLEDEDPLGAEMIRREANALRRNRTYFFFTGTYVLAS